MRRTVKRFRKASWSRARLLPVGVDRGLKRLAARTVAAWTRCSVRSGTDVKACLREGCTSSNGAFSFLDRRQLRFFNSRARREKYALCFVCFAMRAVDRNTCFERVRSACVRFK